jgi:phosphatidate cytidylyltransferase
MGDDRPNVGTAAGALAGRSNLTLRVLSALVMVPLALVTAYLGGWPFNLLWGIAALLMLAEWGGLVRGSESSVTSAWSPRQLMWLAAGVVYAGAMLVATLTLRADSAYGFAAIVAVFAVVWATDIAAYFIGRAVGGPKLMPRVSPSKTWSGAAGGTFAGVVAGIMIGKLFGLGNMLALGAVTLVLSVVSQAGDLLESAVKRHFKVKDSSGLIPGHGGLMDRLDGYVTAVVAAAAIGVARGGLEAPGRGLLVW